MTTTLTGYSTEDDAALRRWLGMHPKRFVCPSCSGSHFGTEDPFGKRIRECHDEYSRGCRWRGTSEECFPSLTYLSMPTLASELAVLKTMKMKCFGGDGNLGLWRAFVSNFAPDTDHALECYVIGDYAKAALAVMQQKLKAGEKCAALSGPSPNPRGLP